MPCALLEPLDATEGERPRRRQGIHVRRRQELKVNGHVYGCRDHRHQHVLYNKKIFREAGLDPRKAAQTIAELDAAAKACTKTTR